MFDLCAIRGSFTFPAALRISREIFFSIISVVLIRVSSVAANPCVNHRLRDEKMESVKRIPNPASLPVLFVGQRENVLDLFRPAGGVVAGEESQAAVNHFEPRVVGSRLLGAFEAIQGGAQFDQFGANAKELAVEELEDFSRIAA